MRSSLVNATAAQPCPCGRLHGIGSRTRPLAFADCCGRYVDHAAAAGAPAEPASPAELALPSAGAPDAESLMRSRYTAFVLQRADYLQATWHASTRPAHLDFDPAAQWLGLAVRDHRSTGEDRAEVEFVARYRVGGRAVRLHERSRFVREAGRWFYVDGDQTP
ncbi:MAG: YchJ family metal-binding protein [Acidovorax sp.]|uniref:YchJ family protein n=1 Tax=Acidovorax sp. TaxID=1872122 RepID=UPI0026279095|nr:YchJ family metal-binding protein [Acidovorax sp.]MDH4464519.1 YchJ family metal-binding protein [Acidovorax sp.]